MSDIVTIDELRRQSKKKAAKRSSSIWTPQDRQMEFMRRKEYECFFGGAAGGGKSDAILVEALRQVDIPHYKALIFRKTYDELNELIDRSIDLYKQVFPKAKFKSSPRPTWTFPSGAKILFRGMQHKKDRKRFQGRAFDLIIFDELTHFTYEEYNYLLSRNRPSGPGTRVYMRATGNPGGVGHAWVKSRFIDQAPPGTPKTYVQKIVDPDGETIKIPRSRIFIPSSVFDNQVLLKNDRNYLASLNMLPKAEREALLYGDWHSFSGQAFSEFKDDPDHYEDRQYTHVIEPFDIPDNWKLYRSYDFGYARPFSVGWWAVDPKDRVYRIREFYGNKDNEPNVGLKWTPQRQARKIKEIEDKYYPNRYIRGIADPSIWDASRGESIAEMMGKLGVHFDPADNERIAGKMQLHYRLAFSEIGLPMMYVFNTCQDFIRTIPALPYDDNDVEDIDTDAEDHIYDEVRYFLMEHVIGPRENKLEEKKYNPLDTNNQEEPNDYSFLRI